MAASAEKVVRYVAIARLSDKVVTCSHAVGSDRQSFDTRVQAVLEHGKWGSVKDHLLIRDGSNAMHLLVGKDKRLYFAITSQEYPQRFISPTGADAESSTLLGEVRAMAEGSEFAERTLSCGPQGLGRVGKSKLRAFADKYNRLEDMDAVTRVKGKLDEVKGVMADNIDAALKSLDAAKAADADAAELRVSADKFKRSSASVERTMRCRSYKWAALIFLLVAGVLAAIIIPIATSS